MKNTTGDRKAQYAAALLKARGYLPTFPGYEIILKDLMKLTVNTLYLLTSGIAK